MSTRLQRLREARAKLIHDAREIVEAAETAGRAELDDEERARYDAMIEQAERMRADIAREERLVEEERALAAREADAAAAPGGGGEGDGGDRRVLNPARATDEYRRAFDNWLQGGRQAIEVSEWRALSAGAPTGGGYLVTPEQFVAQLIKNIDDLVFVRRFGTTIPVAMATSLGVPTLDADPADADWTVELDTGTEDTAMAFGKRELHPHPLAKRIKVSAELLRTSVLDIETLVRTRLAYKFGIAEEKGFLTGTGAQQPLGLFTASADGIPTTRDVSTGNTTSEIRFDGLIEAKYSVKGQYWDRARWIFHRDAMKQVSKLKDGEGQYIWRPSVREGEPDRVLNAPIAMSEYAPNTFTTGLYVGLFGDLSWYWIADAFDLEMRRLDELYAETNQVGFIGRAKVDAAPVLAEAFARVKLG